MTLRALVQKWGDDLACLRSLVNAYRTHPLSGSGAPDPYTEGALCRMFVVFAADALNSLFDSWLAPAAGNELEGYCARATSLAERADRLRAAIEARVQVQQDSVERILALQCLRKAALGAALNDEETSLVGRVGWPSSPAELTGSHLDEIARFVNWFCSLASFWDSQGSQSEPSRENEGSLPSVQYYWEEVMRPLSAEARGILKIKDLNRIVARNLDRLSHHFLCLFTDLVRREAEVSTAERMGEPRDAGTKESFYRAVLALSLNDHPSLVENRELAGEALEFWREYWNRAVLRTGLTEDRIERALEVFEGPGFEPRRFLGWPLLKRVPKEEVEELVARGVVPEALVESEPLREALDAGELAYNVLNSITIPALLALQLPLVDPPNRREYLKEAQRAINLFKLARWWYSTVERGEAPDLSGLSFLLRMRDLVDTEMSRRAGSSGSMD